MRLYNNLLSMFKKIIFFLFIFSLSSLAFAKPAHHIISLAPNITEIAFAVGAGKYLVGTSSYSNYPKAAQNIPVVATYQDLDMERIIRLHPDLVIAWKGGNPLAQIEQLKKLHIPVYTASFNSILDVAKVGLKIGQLADTQAQAQQFAKQFIKHYQQIKTHWQHKKPVSVFYQLSNQPLMTLNKNSSVGQIIQLCGGKNIFANTLTVAPQISIESLIAKNPDVILINRYHPVSDTKWYRIFPQINAVKNHRIYSVDASLTERYSPRILKGAEEVCHFIHLQQK